MAQAAPLPAALPTTAPIRRLGQVRAPPGDAPSLLQALTSLRTLVRTVTSSGIQPASAAAASTPWVALAPRPARGRPRVGAGVVGGRARTKASVIASYQEPESNQEDFVKSPGFQFNQDIKAKASEEKKAKAKGHNAKRKEAPKRTRKYTQLLMEEVARPVDMVGRISAELDELRRPGIATTATVASFVDGVAATSMTPTSSVASVASVAPTSTVASVAPTTVAATLADMACPLCYLDLPSQWEVEQHAAYCRP